MTNTTLLNSGCKAFFLGCTKFLKKNFRVHVPSSADWVRYKGFYGKNAKKCQKSKKMLLLCTILVIFHNIWSNGNLGLGTKLLNWDFGNFPFLGHSSQESQSFSIEPMNKVSY